MTTPEDRHRWFRPEDYKDAYDNAMKQLLFGIGAPQEGRAFMADASTVTVKPHRSGPYGGAVIQVDGHKPMKLDHVDLDRLKTALETVSNMSPGQVTFSLIFPHDKSAEVVPAPATPSYLNVDLPGGNDLYG